MLNRVTNDTYFQAKIQSLKKTASKGDKKKKKEVTEEIAKLEAEMNERHDKELADLKNQTPKVTESGNGRSGTT